MGKKNGRFLYFQLLVKQLLKRGGQVIQINIPIIRKRPEACRAQDLAPATGSTVSQERHTARIQGQVEVTS